MDVSLKLTNNVFKISTNCRRTETLRNCVPILLNFLRLFKLTSNIFIINHATETNNIPIKYLKRGQGSGMWHYGVDMHIFPIKW